MSHPITCALVLALLSAAAGAADTRMYRWVDAQGVVHYSDSPQAGAQAITIAPVQTYKAPPAPRTVTEPSGAASSSASAASDPSTASCSIVSPEPDQTFANPEAVAVSVAVNPGLQSGEQVAISVDGSMLDPTGTAQAQIAQPSRGSHSVTAVVRDVDGKVRCSTQPLTFNVQRTSLLSPASPNRERTH
jgi:hypothetical protein